LFVLAATMSALRKDVRQGFDELAHASYVAEVQAQGRIVPLTEIRMLDPGSFRFTAAGNYINHPAPYYALHALAGPTLEGRPQALFWHRLIDVAIAALALGLLLAAGLALCRAGDELLIYAVTLGCIPVLAPLAGSINNDNLAFLAGALTLFGAQRYWRDRRAADLGLAALGLVAAGLAKLTALMLCGGFLLLLLALLWRREGLRPAHAALVLAALALAAAPAVELWLLYGSPAPDTPAQHALLIDGAREAGWAGHDRLGPFAYGWRFLAAFVDGWMPALANKSPLQKAMLAVPVATLLLAVAGAFLSLKRIAGRGPGTGAIEPVVAAGAVAIAATLAVHVAFSYQRHLATGWMMDAYPRYYLPLVAIAPLATLALLRRVERPGPRHLLAGFLLAGPLAFRLLG
jgi:hypothetical protein